MSSNLYDDDDELFGEAVFGDEDEDLSEFDDDEDEEDNIAEKIAAFDREVARRMKIILSRKQDLNLRIESAYWLGNSGAPKAISALRKVYRGDKDPKMKKATAYALGQFKALDEAIEREDDEPVMEALADESNAHIVELLQGIALGDADASNGPSGGWQRRLIPLLTFTLVMLIGFNALILLGNTEDEEPAPIAEDSLAAAFAIIDNDTNTVASDPPVYEALGTIRGSIVSLEQARLDLALAFQQAATALDNTSAEATAIPADCPFEATIPGEITLAGGEAESVVPALVSTHNEAVRTLTIIQTIPDVACNENRALTTEEIGQAQLFLDDVENAIITMQVQIENEIQRIAVTVTPPTEPSATPSPTPDPNPTLSPTVRRQYVQELLAIVNRVNGRDGAQTLLQQYWVDVESSGRTGGCQERSPAVPVIGPPPDDIVLAQDIELIQAWTQLNDGLVLLQNGWNLFEDACDGPEAMGTQLPIGRPVAETAGELIANANTLLLGGGSSSPPPTPGQ